METKLLEISQILCIITETGGTPWFIFIDQEDNVVLMIII